MAERGTGWSRHLKWAIALFAAGFAFWVVDKTHLLCAPGSLAQGHAVWHLAGAGAAWLLHRHFFDLTNQIKLPYTAGDGQGRSGYGAALLPADLLRLPQAACARPGDAGRAQRPSGVACWIIWTTCSRRRCSTWRATWG